MFCHFGTESCFASDEAWGCEDCEFVPVVVFCVAEAGDEVANIAVQLSVDRLYQYLTLMMLTLELPVYRAALK